MKKLSLVVLFSTLMAAGIDVLAQGTAFTYQGRLNSNQTPASGVYDFEFALYERDIEGKMIGRPIRMRETPVSNGLFTVTLDFGSGIFTGAERWMEIAVANAGGESVILSPRQKVGAAPYAIFSSAAGSVQNTGNAPAVFSAGGTEAMRIDPTGDVGIGGSNRTAQVTVTGSIQSAAVTLLSEDFESASFPPAGWTTGGGQGVGPGWTRTTNTSFQGQAAATCTVSNWIGYLTVTYNFPTAGTVRFAWKLSRTTPCPCAYLGLCVDSDDDYCWYFAPTKRLTYEDADSWKEEIVPVSAGVHTLQWWVGHNSAIAPGGVTGFLDNVRFTGDGNVLVDGALTADTITARSISATTADFQKVAIGTNIPQQLLHLNVLPAHGEGMRIDSAVAGHAPAIYLNHTGPGGHNFRIASYGDNANAGSFRIRDDSLGTDPFVIDANGVIHGNGSGLTLSPNVALLDASQTFTANLTIASPATLSFGAVNRQMLNLYGTDYAMGVQANTLYARSGNHFAWYRNGVHNDGELDPGGGTELMRLSNGGGLHLGGPVSELSLENRDTGTYVQTPSQGQRWVLYSRNEGGSGRLFFWSGNDKASIDTAGNLRTAGAVNPPSDRNVKRDFRPADVQQILERLVSIPIQSWQYTNDPGARHLGPVAQDFHAAFGLGSDDKHIATVDADGVALAAIQGLNEKLETEMKRSREKDAQIAALQERLAKLETLLIRND